jgi:hypothetical protein
MYDAYVTEATRKDVHNTELMNIELCMMPVLLRLPGSNLRRKRKNEISL